MKRAGGSSQQNGRRPRKKAGTITAESSPSAIPEANAAAANNPNSKPTAKASVAASASRGRTHTTSIAISASMIAQLEKPELRTFLAGQIARALSIFQIDEVVIYDDVTTIGAAASLPKLSTEGPFESASKKNFDSSLFLARILQFCECPPYLRKALFPIHRDLQFASMINLECPHHTKVDDPIPFREGVTLETQRKDGTLVDCGLRNGIPCFVKNKAIKPGVRVTVKIDNPAQIHHNNTNSVPATVISPNFPRESQGLYWGYNVRLASSIGKVLSECPFDGGYDLTFGVSDTAGTFVGDLNLKQKARTSNNEIEEGAEEKGGNNIDDTKFKHLMIVFGGAKGIEYSIGADESLSVAEEDCASLFTHFFTKKLPLQKSMSFGNFKTITVTLDKAGVALLLLNRPKSQNAFNSDMMLDLIRSFHAFDSDDNVRAVVVTGAGNFFCGGADFRETDFSTDTSADSRSPFAGFHNHRDGGGMLTLAIHSCRKPVIAAINGAAVGIGITMTLPMDIRLAVKDAKIGFVFNKRGICMEACSNYFLPRLVGHSRALELCLTARISPASHKSLELLFSETSFDTKEQLLTAAMKIAHEIATNTSSVSAAVTKALIWHGGKTAQEAHLLDSKALQFLGNSKDAKEGVLSFLEKRQPEFKDTVSENLPPNYPWWLEVDVSTPASRALESKL
ncbi:hypothetical protein HK100_001078 [Physocladia obscura]|uniref:Enoyl-CoA hydratase n=1 Tax=Physocladia obscura TaxID=109957 RepID=A0AAD5SYE7_9FUNG|nr:hypothetical protein HK100_001078 [Physocladia obscura]